MQCEVKLHELPHHVQLHFGSSERHAEHSEAICTHLYNVTANNLIKERYMKPIINIYGNNAILNNAPRQVCIKYIDYRRGRYLKRRGYGNASLKENTIHFRDMESI